MRAEPKPQQKFRRQQHNMMAGGTIDLDEIAMPEILDPRQDRATAIASRHAASPGAKPGRRNASGSGWRF
jgi:hypothetical protein